MKIVVCDDYQKMSEEAYKEMKDVVVNKPKACLGFATGSTPLGLYKEMIKDYEKGNVSYKEVTTFNLDEYKGLDYSSDQSYIYFMRSNLFDHIDVDLKNVNIENGKADDKDKECERYNNLLANHELDIQVLGIGSNGHIAFNEPGTPFDSVTHVVKLTENTIKDNSRFFKTIDEVPKEAYTMGLKNIMEAKKIIILANGLNKAKAVYGLVKGEINESCPASILRNHDNCILFVDKDAASLL